MKTKTQITNRILSIFLCFVMLFSLTMPAMATEDDTYTLYINISQVVDSTKEVSGVYLWIQNDTESIIFNETMNNETGTVYSYSVPNSYTSGIIQFWYTDGEGSLNYYFDFDATGNNLYTPTGEEEGTWEVYSDCPHESYTDGKCDTCGTYCPHENITDGKCDDCGAEGIFVTITMNDSYGDGWNGNAVKIEQLIDGVYTEVATATIEDGASETYTAVLPKDGIYAYTWVNGSYSDECSFTVTVNGEIVYEALDGSHLTDGQVFYVICEHTGGTQTCKGFKCEVCMQWYGEAGEQHDLSTEQTCKGYKCNLCYEYFGEKGEHASDTEQTCKGYKCKYCYEWYGEADTSKHNWDYGYCDYCGIEYPVDEECTHNFDDDGICTSCSSRCPHEIFENGTCTSCSYLLPFSLTIGETVTYHGSFADALDKAEDGSVIKLLKNYADYNGVEINKAITLDLNGKTWDQPSLGQHTVTADVTFTDSVGDGVCSYGFNLLSPCTFEGGSYRYIWIKYETGDTLEDLLAPCCSYYSNGEVVDLSGQTSIGSGIEISANHIPGTQNCLGYKCENCGKYFGEVDADAHDWSNVDGICANGCGATCPHENETGETCTVCGVSLHTCDFSGEWKYDGSKHWKECAVDNCDKTAEEAVHAFEKGECTVCDYVCLHESYTDGVCDNCKYECLHDWNEGVLTRPTATEKGYYTYTCELCGDEKTETVESAETALCNDLLTKVFNYSLDETLTEEATTEIYQIYQSFKNNNSEIIDKFGFLRDDLIASEQGIVNEATAELQEIVDAIEAKIASGEYVKADYTAIDEAIAEIEQKLADENITDEGKAELAEIKTQLEEMKADGNTSEADLAELEKALEDYETELDAGIADGTLVEVDGKLNEIVSEIIQKWSEKLESEGLTDEYEDFINNNKATDEALAAEKEINDFAYSLEGAVADNAENLAKLEEMMNSLLSELENCLRGTHNFNNYEITTPAKCGENAIETGTCWLCGETDEREVEGSALKHSFTKYKEVTAPECGKAGLEKAICDNGCDATDEKVIPALEHIFVDYTSNGDATCEADGTKTAECIYGCGKTDTVTDEGSKLSHTDEDGDKLCDDCQAEIIDTCPHCGNSVHEGLFSELICLLIMFIRLVTSFVSAIS